jgi:hypothetical protein
MKAKGMRAGNSSSMTGSKKYTGVYFLLPVMRINLQVLPASGGMICSLVDPCLFGDTGIEPAGLDS